MSSRFLGARRGLALSASVLIGLGSAVALPAAASAQRPGGYHSAVSGVATCDAAANEWVVDWTVTSTAPPVIRAWRLVEVVADPPGSVLTGIATSDEFERIEDLVGVQRLPGTATSAELGVRAQWSDGFQEAELRWGTVTFDEICGTEPVPPGPVTVEQTNGCDQLSVQVSNPDDGVAAEVLVTTGDGGHELSPVAPGESWTFEFPASEGLTYEVSVDGAVIASGGWQAPEDCDQPGPPGNGDGGDDGNGDGGDGDDAGAGLPVTGGQTGAVIGAALALLAVGGGLFWLARRRRVTFSA